MPRFSSWFKAGFYTYFLFTKLTSFFLIHAKDAKITVSQLDYTVNRRVGKIQTARLIARKMQLNATTIAPALQIARMVALIAKGRVSFYSLA